MNLKRITALLLAIALQLALLAGGIPSALAEGAPQIPGLTFVAETPRKSTGIPPLWCWA